MTSFLACVFYAVVSTSITFFNKIVLSTYSFDSSNIMTLAQIIFSLVFLVSMKAMNLITYSELTWSTSLSTSPLSISFLGMVLTGLGALKFLNIPMFNALRRVTTLITMAGEYYLLDKRESGKVQFSVYLMVIGAIVAGIYDFDFNFYGYILVALNCIFTAAYLLSIAKFGKQGLNTFGLMYYNNIQSLPLVIILCLIGGDFNDLYNYTYFNDIGFWICFILQSALAFLLNYSIFLCTNVNSALATSVTGQIKNIATTAIGYFTFGDVTYNLWNVIGLACGVVASTWYSWLKFDESERGRIVPILPIHNPRLHNDNEGGLASSLLTTRTSKHVPVPHDEDDCEDDSHDHSHLLQNTSHASHAHNHDSHGHSHASHSSHGHSHSHGSGHSH